MDALVLENYVILKSQITGEATGENVRDEYLAQFQLD
jgi:hypothetical protein